MYLIVELCLGVPIHAFEARGKFIVSQSAFCSGSSHHAMANRQHQRLGIISTSNIHSQETWYLQVMNILSCLPIFEHYLTGSVRQNWGLAFLPKPQFYGIRQSAVWGMGLYFEFCVVVSCISALSRNSTASTLSNLGILFSMECTYQFLRPNRRKKTTLSSQLLSFLRNLTEFLPGNNSFDLVRI